jgi:hypothetical protein
MKRSWNFQSAPFYQRPRFIRNTIIFFLVGLFIVLFRSELTQLWQLIREPALISNPETTKSIFILFWNGILFLSSFLLAILLVSQYILPVQTNEQRGKVLQRLIAYLTRQHGPAVFVKEGKEIAKKSELLSSLPGVAFIDLASAIALAKQSPPKTSGTTNKDIQNQSIGKSSSATSRRRRATAVRIAGPGIAFTESGETIRGVIDLRHKSAADGV